jgi:formylmethanofuran dehydrogenase subunit E
VEIIQIVETNKCQARDVSVTSGCFCAAAILADVEPGFQPGGKSVTAETTQPNQDVFEV